MQMKYNTVAMYFIYLWEYFCIYTHYEVGNRVVNISGAFISMVYVESSVLDNDTGLSATSMQVLIMESLDKPYHRKHYKRFPPLQ